MFRLEFTLCRAIAAGCALLLSFAVCADDEVSRETRRWIETVEAGATVRVINPYGNVYSRFGGYTDEVEIQATSQRLEPDLPQLGVSFRPTDFGLDVRVGAKETGVPDPETTRDQVDLVIFVPRGVLLEIQTADGSIEAKGLKSDLSVSSVKGDILLRGVEGRVQAKTARGKISAVLESAVTDEAQSLTTETGEIEVHLWEDASLDARIATSGEISTDFSIEIEHRRFEEPGKHAVAGVGEGGPRLTLESRRGNVRLLRLQKDFTSDKTIRGNP